jgi:hypothetical protein
MGFMILDGKILIVDGAIAMSDNCCCNKCSYCSYSRYSVTISNSPSCRNADGTWTVEFNGESSSSGGSCSWRSNAVNGYYIVYVIRPNSTSGKGHHEIYVNQVSPSASCWSVRNNSWSGCGSVTISTDRCLWGNCGCANASCRPTTHSAIAVVTPIT